MNGLRPVALVLAAISMMLLNGCFLIDPPSAAILVNNTADPIKVHWMDDYQIAPLESVRTGPLSEFEFNVTYSDGSLFSYRVPESKLDDQFVRIGRCGGGSPIWSRCWMLTLQIERDGMIYAVPADATKPPARPPAQPSGFPLRPKKAQ